MPAKPARSFIYHEDYLSLIDVGSYCKRQGAIVSAVPAADLKVLQGQTALHRFQFGRRVAEHFFCGICGVYTHHRRSTNPNEFDFNIGCLQGVNPFDLGTLQWPMVVNGTNLKACLRNANCLDGLIGDKR